MMTPAEVEALPRPATRSGRTASTHPDLTTLSDTTSRASSRTRGRCWRPWSAPGRCRGLAYPFGNYDARVIAAAQAAGYRSARSVEEGYNSPATSSRTTSAARTCTSTTTIATFASWVDYAKAHDYWLVIIYHEVVPDDAPPCTEPGDGRPLPRATTTRR